MSVNMNVFMHPSRRPGLAAQLPGQELRDVLEDDRGRRAGEGGRAKDLVVDAVLADDFGLAEVAGKPIEGRRRERDAVAGTDALVAVDPAPGRPSARADRGESAERERRRLCPARRAEPRQQPGEALRDVLLAELELGRDLGVRPALGQQPKQRGDRRRPGGARPRTTAAGSRPAPVGPSIGPGQLDQLRARPGPQPADTDRLVERPWAIRERACWRYSADEALRPPGGPPASTARAAGRMISRLVSSCIPFRSASNAARAGGDGRLDVAAREGDRGESGVGLSAPGRVAGQERRGAPSPAPRNARRGPREQRRTVASSVRALSWATRDGLDGHEREAGATRTAPTPGRPRRDRDRALEVAGRMPSASPARALGPSRATISSCRARIARRAVRRGSCRQGRASAPRPSTSPSSRSVMRDAACGGELDRPGRPGASPRGGPPRPARGRGRARPWRGRTRGHRTASGGPAVPARSP